MVASIAKKNINNMNFKYLKNYEIFINESVEIDDLPLILSDDLLETLSKINHKIAQAFIKLHNDNKEKFNVSFIDKHPTQIDTVTQILVNKAKLVLDDDDLNNLDKLYKQNHQVYQRYRSDIKIGRLVNKIFEDKFPRNKTRNYNEDIPNDIESFVNMYKVANQNFDDFEIVEGSDIAYWYYNEKYSNDDGSLGSSCMGDVGDDFFELYTDNSKKIKMLILHPSDDNNTIKGRALLWYLDEPSNRIFMERIYTNDYSDEQLFKEYAKQNGWLYKLNQTYDREYIVDTKTNTSKNMDMKIYLDNVEFDKYPYLDTMCYLDKENKFLSTDPKSAPFILKSSYGHIDVNSEYDDPDNYVYSNYHEEDINKDDAKYCEIGDDWVKEDEAIYICNSGGKYAVPGDESIVHSDYTDKWFLKSRAVYSEILKSYIFEDAARKVFYPNDKKRFEYTHKNDIDVKLNKHEIYQKKKNGKYYFNIE